LVQKKIEVFSIKLEKKKISVIITAGGSGNRLPGKVKKQFLEINNKAILYHTIERFLEIDIINEIIISLPAQEIKAISQNLKELYPQHPIICVKGGKERQASVFNALKACSKDSDVVFIHDGVRPLFGDNIIEDSLRIVDKHVGVIPASKVKFTIKECHDNTVTKTVARDNLYNVHTPQCFLYEDIFHLHEVAHSESRNYTDDAALYEHAGYEVKIVSESDLNIKITTIEDLELAKYYLKKIKYSGVYNEKNY
jgi:2-C-methyl-D-erythritol 4-phosphate cytidylyltransferase